MSAAFLFVQHFADSVHASFRADMQVAFQRQDISVVEWATYLDRYLLNHSRPQRYGTQRERRVRADGTEEDYLSPLENPAALDSQRRALGLDALMPELWTGTFVIRE